MPTLFDNPDSVETTVPVARKPERSSSAAEIRSNLISAEFERAARERLPDGEPPWDWLRLSYQDDFDGGSPHLVEAISKVDAMLAKPSIDPAPWWATTKNETNEETE